MAKDQDLNQYLSVKKYAPYKTGIRWDGQRGQRLKEFKQKLAERMDGDDTQVVGSGGPPLKKRKGKKERLKMRGTQADGIAVTNPGTEEEPIKESGGKKRRKHDELDLAGGTDENREEEKMKKIERVGFDEKSGRNLKGEHGEELEERAERGGEARKKRRRHKKGHGKATHEQD
jgi:protein KRI1